MNLSQLLDAALSNFTLCGTSLLFQSSWNFSKSFKQRASSWKYRINRTDENTKEKKQRSTTVSPVHQQDEYFTSSRQAKSSYLTWTKSRAELRERARAVIDEHEGKVTRRPWRWTFQRSDDRERLRREPMTTKKWHGKREHVCHPKFHFPQQQFCSFKHWFNKHIRP